MIALADPPPAEQPAAGRSIHELTSTVSASRLNTWQQCRLKFFFRYIAAIPKAATPALHYGITVHAVLQQWNLARWRRTVLEPETLKEIFLKAWESPREGAAIDWEGEEEAIRQSAWAVLETYFRETPIPADEKPEGVEVGVEADLSSHGLPTLIGVLDLVRQGGRIVDFKTAARSPEPEMLAHTTETQTSAYGVLYREATGQPETGIELHHLVKTKTPKLIVTGFGPVRETQVTRLFHVMEAYVEGLEREDFTPSPGMQCSSCQFFNECRVWC